MRKAFFRTGVIVMAAALCTSAICAKGKKKDNVMDMVEKIRSEWGESDAKRDAGYATPDDVKRYDNIQYGEDPVWQSLDVYRPLAAAEAGQVLPVIVSVHGGGWVYGTKEVYQYYCMSLCQRGFVVVNFNYRLAPENPFPAGIEDEERVFEWVKQNAEQYGIDANNIFAVGDSAGGHMLALYAATHDGVLRAVGLDCGAYHGPDGDLQKALCPNINPKQSTKQLNAIDKIKSTFPPTFCMTSSGDFLKDEATSLCSKLAQVNVPFELHFYGTSDNILPHVFHVDIKRPEATECNDDTVAWFNKWTAQ